MTELCNQKGLYNLKKTYETIIAGQHAVAYQDCTHNIERDDSRCNIVYLLEYVIDDMVDQFFLD